jgi:hypothetical protein
MQNAVHYVPSVSMCPSVTEDLCSVFRASDRHDAKRLLAHHGCLSHNGHTSIAEFDHAHLMFESRHRFFDFGSPAIPLAKGFAGVL